MPPGRESSREMLGLKDLQMKEEGQSVPGRGKEVGSSTRPEVISKYARECTGNQRLRQDLK